MIHSEEQAAAILRQAGMSDKEQAMFAIIRKMSSHKITIQDLIDYMKGRIEE